MILGSVKKSIAAIGQTDSVTRGESKQVKSKMAFLLTHPFSEGWYLMLSQGADPFTSIKANRTGLQVRLPALVIPVYIKLTLKPAITNNF